MIWRDQGWKKRAACLGDLKFTERPIDDQIWVCAGCPVREECRDFGREYGAGGVVYGGLQMLRHHRDHHTRGR
jgi:hypothetical protein